MPGEALRRALDPELVDFRYVNFPASYGPATGIGDPSYAESVRAGMKAMLHEVRATPYPAIVSGYSQGACVAVRFARDILPAAHDLDVRAVATMGDPHQERHQGRSGIAGPLSTPRPRLSVYAAGDPIADLPDGSPMRTIADMTAWMSLRSVEAGRLWALDILENLPTKWQRWWAPLRWPAIEAAPGYALGYLQGDRHMRDYVTKGHVARLARMIEEVA